MHYVTRCFRQGVFRVPKLVWLGKTEETFLAIVLRLIALFIFSRCGLGKRDRVAFIVSGVGHWKLYNIFRFP